MRDAFDDVVLNVGGSRSPFHTMRESTKKRQSCAGISQELASALVQIIMNAPIEWQRERLILIDMVTHYLERNPQVDPQSKRPAGRGDPAPPQSRH